MTGAPDEGARVLDGNAAAGVLREVLAVEPTSAVVTCAHCGARGPLGAHVVFADAPALVVRCPSCMEVVVRCASDEAGVRLDMAGVRLLTVPREALTGPADGA